MYRIMLVEDDLVQRNILKTMLNELDFHLEIYEASKELDALTIAKDVTIDFFIIDIQLENSSGLSLALNLRKIPKYEFSWVVFLTTHIEYITEAFKKVHCYDYILKPYDKEKVLDMVNRIICHNTKQTIKKERQYVIFNLKNELSIKIYIDEIIFLEVSGRTCIVHTLKFKYTVNRISLKKALLLINCDYIIQSHKSFAVNINYINKISKIDNKLHELYFENYKESALLGYKYKNSILDKFKNY